MSYSKLLKKIVGESKYNYAQIVEECNKRGVKFDKAYISKLANGKVPPPSEEISRTIANVCETDERNLVLEGYIEKAPKEIKEAFVSIKYMTTIATLSAFENHVDKKTLKELEEQMLNEPIADFIIDLIDNKTNTNVNIDKNKFELQANVNVDRDKFEFEVKENEINVRLTEPIALIVKDNAMFPIIPENAEITLKLQDKYESGDILAIKIKEQEGFIVRYVLFQNNQIILTPLNNIENKYKKLIYNSEDIIILGKVIKVIKTIQN